MQAKNQHKSWAQGFFVDQPKYARLTAEQKKNADDVEKHFVRPSPTGNAICKCEYPQDAAWIASRLNLAAKVETMIVGYVSGKMSSDHLESIVDNIVRGVYEQHTMSESE